MLANVSLFSQLACPSGFEPDTKLLNPVLDTFHCPFKPSLQPPSLLCAQWADLCRYQLAPLPCSFWLTSRRRGNMKSAYLFPWLPPCQLDESLHLLNVSFPLRQPSAHGTVHPWIPVLGTAPCTGSSDLEMEHPLLSGQRYCTTHIPMYPVCTLVVVPLLNFL